MDGGTQNLPAPPSYPGHTPTHTTALPIFPLPQGGHTTCPAPSLLHPSSGSTDSTSPAFIAYAPPGCGSTHFNLDQLLEIVQSFRLDTTHALSAGSSQVDTTALNAALGGGASGLTVNTASARHASGKVGFDVVNACRTRLKY